MRGEESTAGLLPLSCSLLDSRIAQQGVSTQPDMNAITSIALEYMYPCVAQFKGAVANPYSKSGNPCSSPDHQREGLLGLVTEVFGIEFVLGLNL